MTGASVPAPGGAGWTGLAPARARLDNGVSVIAKETRTTPAVTLHANLRAGTVWDPAGLTGLAHFVSRTIDRGTRRRGADDLAEQLDRRGVSLAVTVGRHVLSLTCTCLARDFADVLGLLAEVVREPTFPEVEVETRRAEIVTLIRQDDDSPAAVAGDALMAVLYGDAHPYGRPVKGTLESVARIDAAALRQFHAARCVPSSLSLVIVGDVPPTQAVARARECFGDWRGGERDAEPAPPVPAPAARRVRVLPMRGKAQADLAYGFVSIARADPAYDSHWLLNNILGQYALGGRLGDSIRERQGMAYYVFSSLDASLLPGPLLVRAGVSADNVRRAVASVDAELSRLAADGPTEQELAESKEYLIGSLPRTLETNMGIAAYLQMVELFGLGADYDVRVAGLLRAVTLDQVHAAARRVLDPARAAVVVAGPYEGPLS